VALTRSGSSPTQHLEQEQALARQFAQILHFTLRFDELKVFLSPVYPHIVLLCCSSSSSSSSPLLFPISSSSFSSSSSHHPPPLLLLFLVFLSSTCSSPLHARTLTHQPTLSSAAGACTRLLSSGPVPPPVPLLTLHALLQMTNPAIQNDFSYYRRTISRMRINNLSVSQRTQTHAPKVDTLLMDKHILFLFFCCHL
jgi:hypothetical protein